MPTWRDDKILELAGQLSYSPGEKRQEQLRSAMKLAGEVDAEKEYPWDFVHFRVTGFQSRGHVEHTIGGAVLRADLATLVEFLSDTLSIRVEEAQKYSAAGDAVLSLDEVTRKFGVTCKTIQRWRKQGLMALKFVYPDGRHRLGFFESAVQAFAATNKERVDRAADFKQLTEEEKSRIVSLARQCVGMGQHSIKEISHYIARQVKRSPETIRYTLRKYDREHPEAAVFGEEAEVRTPKTEILHEPQTTNHEPRTTNHEGSGKEFRAASVEIEFVANPLFEHPDAENIILKVLPEEALAKAQASVTAGVNAKAGDVFMARMPRDLPAFLQEIFRQPVMPEELERDAFRRMNYLKWKAARVQRDLDLVNPSSAEMAGIESRLGQALEIKNLLVQCNLRIAVHVARKHQRPDRPLMELVSDATVWLMRAVETFDFSKHTKFSTYASYAMMKNFARGRADRLTQRERNVLTGQEELLNAVGAPEEGTAEKLDAAAIQNDLMHAIHELPQRDRELLASHYGLNQQNPAMSLAEIGDKMGITKTRAQQLEARALRRLRHLLESRRHKLQRAARGGGGGGGPLPLTEPIEDDGDDDE